MGNRDRRGIRRQPRGNFKRRLGTDARNRILSKKRKGVRDARDVLIKKAKMQDARDKISRIRQSKTTFGGDKVEVRAIGSNILRKTDRNGKISLTTGRNSRSTATTTTGINLAVQQQLGLIGQVRKKTYAVKETRVASPERRKTVLTEYAPPSLPMLLEAYKDYYLNPGARTTRPVVKRHQEWTYTPRAYIDLDAPEDEEMSLIVPSPVKQTIVMHGTTRSSNVHSRLDTSPNRGYSHGIFAAPTKTKVVVPTGHRIVVSNLQDGVTEDDIRELFEDIGQLLVARLVRPGTAEVIYKNLKDAQRAVDTYHNRQLDGQPMKCLLVNKRPFNNPIAPALSNSSLSRLAPKKLAPSKSTDKLVPDLETIHKVLFQRN